MSEIPCRLCGARARALFRLKYLIEIDVEIYRCTECDSLETEEPYWLEIAYASELLDYGADTATRCMNLEAWVAYVTVLFGKRPSTTRVIDYGSGPGLLVRMLRDVGFDAVAYEPYTPGMLARGFVGDITEPHDILVAIETFEHFANPAKELEQIFSPGHDLVVIRTQPYRDEGPDWYYFFPEVGQHVFFYSHKAREWIARKYGYDVRSHGDMSIFSKKKITRLQSLALRRSFFPLVGVRALMPLLPRGGLTRDMDRASEMRRERISRGTVWNERVRTLRRDDRSKQT